MTRHDDTGKDEALAEQLRRQVTVDEHGYVHPTGHPQDEDARGEGGSAKRDAGAAPPRGAVPPLTHVRVRRSTPDVKQVGYPAAGPPSRADDWMAPLPGDDAPDDEP